MTKTNQPTNNALNPIGNALNTGLFAPLAASLTLSPAPAVKAHVARLGVVEHRETTLESLTCSCGNPEVQVSRFYVVGRGYLRVSYCSCSRLGVL